MELGSGFVDKSYKVRLRRDPFGATVTRTISIREVERNFWFAVDIVDIYAPSVMISLSQAPSYTARFFPTWEAAATYARDRAQISIRDGFELLAETIVREVA